MVILSTNFELRAILLPMTSLTTFEALAFGLALDFCFEPTLGLGTFFYFLFFFAEEEEEHFSATCTLLAWPRIPSAAWSSF